MNDEGVHDEELPGCCCRAAALAGALVDLPEIGRIEANIGPGRGREALSAARNRVCGGNHREIRARAPRSVRWRRCQAVGGMRHVQDDDDDRRCDYWTAVGVQSGLHVELVLVVAYEDPMAFNPGRVPPGPGSRAVLFEQQAAWRWRRPGSGSGGVEAWSATARRQPVGLVGGQASGCCKYLSHPTDACRSVGAERNRG